MKSTILFAQLLVLLLSACNADSQIVMDESTLSPPNEAVVPTEEIIPTKIASDIEDIVQSTEIIPSEDIPRSDDMKTADANVIYVKAIQASDGSWTFHVTVTHPDTGWDDYTNGWDVVTPDNSVIKPDPNSAFTRLLLHPHVNDQPFTRSQANIVIPAGVTIVTVRAHDFIDGFGGLEVAVDLSIAKGENYEVQIYQ